MFKDYYEVRDWLEGFIPYTYSKKNLGLERIRHLIKLLGNPQEKFKSVLVGGTSGKGSTAYYIARLLEFAGPVSSFPPAYAKAPAGKPARIIDNSAVPLEAKRSGVGSPSRTATRKFKVGLHVSPHLVDIRERMQIFVVSQTFDPVSKILHETGSSSMPMRQLLELIGKLRPVVEKIQKEKPDLVPSYFEILVAASILYFAQEKVDWAVVEVGLGGRLDATNVLKQEISVITNVGLDHTEILGNTIEQIAGEKAGIIKRSMRSKGSVITGARGKALEVIEKVAKEKNARLININTLSSKNLQKTDAERYIAKQYYAFRSSSDKLASPNKNLALLTVLSLGVELDANSVKTAFSNNFPGRLEQINQNVILDGAHNVDKIRFLISSILRTSVRSSHSVRTIDGMVLVVAFKKGKDWKKMLSLLVKNLPVNKIIATRFNAPTDTGFFAAVEPEEIENYIKSKWKVKVESFEISQQAVFEALKTIQLSNPLRPPAPTRNRGERGEASYPTLQLALVTGSLYLIGEVRTLWELPNF